MSEPLGASAPPAAVPPATVPGSAQGAYRWYILVLAALTHTLVVGMPMMSLPVLFDEIGTDLSLNLVQIGYVWGASSLLGIAMSLTGGVIGDRIGARRMLVFACLLSGVTGGNAGACKRLRQPDCNRSGSRSLPDGRADECP